MREGDGRALFVDGEADPFERLGGAANRGEEAELGERADARRQQPFAARLVAREARAIDEQHLEAAARAGERGGAAGRSGAGDDDVDARAHRPRARGR